MPELNAEKHPPFAARIGIDWADQKHFWSMLTADGKRTHGNSGIRRKRLKSGLSSWPGAKGDPSDADLILDYLVKHPEWLRCQEPDTVATRERSSARRRTCLTR